MNAMRALAVALGAVTASLATAPSALAWPACSHAAGTGDTSSHSQAVLQRLMREHLILRHAFATDRWNTPEDSDEGNRRGSHIEDGATRMREGLVLPEQPRWRM